MRVLVAGGAGFIGSHLVERFLAQGHEVIAVDNLSSGRLVNLASMRGSPRFTFVEHDVTEPIDIRGDLDWILHFASPASPPKYLEIPIETLRVNGEGSYRLLELSRKKSAAFLLASTSEVYGDPLVHPQPETYWGNVNSIGPRSVYDEAKRYAEAMTSAYRAKFGLPVRIVRIFNTHGPRMDPNDGRVVTNFITQTLRRQPITIYGDGSQTRSFQFIDDLVNGVTKLMNVDYSLPVNIGNPEEYTILQFAQLIRGLMKSDLQFEFRPLPVDDPRQRKPDISTAQQVLDWTPACSVLEGLSRTIDHFSATFASTDDVLMTT